MKIHIETSTVCIIDLFNEKESFRSLDFLLSLNIFRIQWTYTLYI